VRVDENSNIKADAIQNGNGGRVVLWSDSGTTFGGSISSKGGSDSGNGGYVEVSAKNNLLFNGLVDTSSVNGLVGNLLVDPTDELVDATYVSNTILNNLATTNVTVSATNSISIVSPIAYTGGSARSLTFNSESASGLKDKPINWGADISSSSGALDVIFNGKTVLTADVTINTPGSIAFKNTLDGNYVLNATVGSAGKLVFNDAVGATTPLASIVAGSTGQTYINANITTAGSQTYNNPVLFGTIGAEQFSNGDFSSGWSGWTYVNSRVQLGVDSIGGSVTPRDTDYTNIETGSTLAHVISGCNTVTGVGCDTGSVSTGTLSSTLITGTDAYSGQSVRLLMSGANCSSAGGYCIVRGPYLISDNAISLSSGDTVSFAWKAANGGDYYDVYAYLLNTASGSTISLLNQTGNTTNWAVKSKTLTNSDPSGNYKFVFVAGSWDASGGSALGASLYIDSVTTSSNNSATYFNNTACTSCTVTGSAVNFGSTANLGSAAVTINNSGTSAISGVVSGSGSLAKSGTGALTLSGANTYSGGTTISAGTLKVGASSAGTAASITNGALGKGAVTVSSGAALDINGKTILNALTLNGSGVNSDGALINSDTGNSGNVGNTVALNTDSMLGGAGDFTITGVISGTNKSLSKVGSGELTLTGANTYTGGTTVGAGTLNVTGSLSDSTDVAVESGATYSLGANDTVGSISGAGSINLNSRTLTVDSSSNKTYSGQMSGTGNLVKLGTGSLTLSGTNSYTGTTTVSRGTVVVTRQNNLGSGQVSIGNNGTLDLSNALYRSAFNLADNDNFIHELANTNNAHNEEVKKPKIIG